VPTPSPTPTPVPTPTSSPPFRSAVSDDYLRALLTDIFIEGGDPAANYVLNYETAQFTSAGFFRIRLILTDITSGRDIAMWTRQAQEDFTGSIPDTVFLTRGSLPEYSGTTALASIDWSAIDWSRTALTQYRTADEAGIAPNRIIPRQQIIDEFAAGADPKIVLTVGAGLASGKHFNSFTAAIESLYIEGISLNRARFPCSDIAAFTNQVLIECVDDGYSEEMPAELIDGVASGILIPPFVTLRGRGDTRLFVPDNGLAAPVIEAPFSMRIENMMLENLSRGYTIHIDGFNTLTRLDPDGNLHFPIVSVMENVQFIGSVQQTSWLLGCGICNGQLIRLDNCDVRTARPAALFGCHNSPGDVVAGRIEVVDSTFNDADFPNSAAFQLLRSYEQREMHELVLTNSTYGTISNGTTIGGGPAFVVTVT
jgi:hypothetical protein